MSKWWRPLRPIIVDRCQYNAQQLARYECWVAEHKRTHLPDSVNIRDYEAERRGKAKDQPAKPVRQHKARGHAGQGAGYGLIARHPSRPPVLVYAGGTGDFERRRGEHERHDGHTARLERAQAHLERQGYRLSWERLLPGDGMRREAELFELYGSDPRHLGGNTKRPGREAGK